MCFYRHQTRPFLWTKVGSKRQIGIFGHFWTIFGLFLGHNFFSNSLIEPILFVSTETHQYACRDTKNGHCHQPKWVQRTKLAFLAIFGHFWPFLAILGWCMPHSLLIFGTDYCNHEIFKWFKLKRDLRCGATVRAI